MKRIVALSLAGDELTVCTRVYIDPRCADAALATQAILDGIERLAAQSPYMLGERALTVRTVVERVERFSFGAVNVRVQDTPVRRLPGLLRIFNTGSRAYFGARRRGILKLIRFLLRFPDVFINLGGRDPHAPGAYAVLTSVVEHEFAHVWGCRDQYRYRDDAKRRTVVADDDLMYRVGLRQRLQPYHIAALCACARRGGVPIRRI